MTGKDSVSLCLLSCPLPTGNTPIAVSYRKGSRVSQFFSGQNFGFRSYDKSGVYKRRFCDMTFLPVMPAVFVIRIFLLDKTSIVCYNMFES